MIPSDITNSVMKSVSSLTDGKIHVEKLSDLFKVIQVKTGTHLDVSLLVLNLVCMYAHAHAYAFEIPLSNNLQGSVLYVSDPTRYFIRPGCIVTLFNYLIILKKF